MNEHISSPVSHALPAADAPDPTVEATVRRVSAHPPWKIRAGFLWTILGLGLGLFLLDLFMPVFGGY